MKKYIVIATATVIAIAAVLLMTSKDSNVSAPIAKSGDYIAMGDSVAAGIGLQDYSDSSACDRTQQSYPYVVAQKLNYNVVNVACSGATTSAGLIGPQNVNKLKVTPQIDILSPDRKPKLISITIGANDADWTSYIQKCYTQACGSAADTTDVNQKMATATTNVVTALQKIAATYPSEPPRVVVTGYYKLLAPNPTPNCAELSGIDESEHQWIGQLQDSVNSSLETATKEYPFAAYANIDFSGHQLCSGDPWIQGIGANKPYHPTEEGQKTIADAVVQAAATTKGAQ